mmetsp:Transcript_26429/g.88884  ORF Transcript_26429/g.88884 Transcript_26429/m.88884 type:complete len:239 (-) Transcript_26429:170-886(-)
MRSSSRGRFARGAPLCACARRRRAFPGASHPRAPPPAALTEPLTTRAWNVRAARRPRGAPLRPLLRRPEPRRIRRHGRGPRRRARLSGVRFLRARRPARSVAPRRPRRQTTARRRRSDWPFAASSRLACAANGRRIGVLVRRSPSSSLESSRRGPKSAQYTSRAGHTARPRRARLGVVFQWPSRRRPAPLPPRRPTSTIRRYSPRPCTSPRAAKGALGRARRRRRWRRTRRRRRGARI